MKTVEKAEIMPFLKQRAPAMRRLLKRFVCCESPSDSKAAVDRLGKIVATEWANRGARVEFLQNRAAGDHLRVTWPDRSGRSRSSAPDQKQVLVLGHLDTVYELGTIKTMPFRESDGKAFGPGIFDMKGGLVIALFAADALAHAGCLPARQIVFLWTSDEETGSETSRKLIENEARKSAAVLVLEPASGPDGKLKTRRKAVGTAELSIKGRSAHAVLEPERGVNAVHELALQTERLIVLNNPRRGISVNPTIAQGGKRSNVIPDEAHLTLDLRAERMADVKYIEKKLRTLRGILPGAKVKVDGGFSRPPLEWRASAQLFAVAKALGQELGITLGECLAGGGSDGNFTAGIGIPTLDGLGAVGAGAHSAGEYIMLSSLPERAALLANLLATL